MSLSVEVDPNVAALLRSIGLLDADGHMDSSWFQDPMAGVSKILADPVQRAALLQLLEDVLGTAGDSPEGSEWVPLLDTDGLGNVYLTVTGDVIGVAAALETPPEVSPSVSAGVRLPLIDTAGDVRAIAGTAEGPIEIAIDLELEPGAPVEAVRLRVTVDIEGHAALRFVLEGVDAGAGPETLEVSTESFGRDLARAVETLVRDAVGAGPAGDPLVDHLFGALGLDGELPPLPFDQLLSHPDALRTWLAQIAGNAADLRAWFAHLAGLLGADPPPVADPLTATLLELAGGDARLVLQVAKVGGDLTVGLGVVAAAAAARLEAGATLFAIPLDSNAPVRVVPRAAVHVRAPGGDGLLVSNAPDIQVGSFAAGLAFNGVGLVPELMAVDVVLGGTAYPTLDLTDANAVVGAAAAGVRGEITAALGADGPAQALLALLGILAPTSDPTTPHLIDMAALARGPTGAIAEIHRAVLADPNHDWSHMLSELASMLGLAGAVAGTGTVADPWRTEIASDGALALDLAAWNARDPSTPAGEQRLRIGLLGTATAAVAPWAPRLLSELLAFDLPVTGPAAVRLIGEQRVELALSPVPEADPGIGIVVRADAVRAVAAWKPDHPLVATVRAENVRVEADGDEVGPVTLVFPPANPSAPDLGLGAGIPELFALLRLLGRHALHMWGGEGAHALGRLLGLYGDGPLLELPDPNDLGSLFAHPGQALRAHLQALALDVGEDGRPYAEEALASVAGLLRDQVPGADGLARLDAAILGAGTYEAPWALPLPTVAGERAEVLLWLDPEGPPASWANALVARVAGAADAATLVGLLPRLAAFLPDLPDWVDPEVDGGSLEALAEWVAAGDGASPLASQLPGLPGWLEGAPLASHHDAQPRDPRAIEQIRGQLEEWRDEDGGRAVLFVGPPWADHTAWNDLLVAVEPSRPTGAHFDLRGGVAPASVTAVATHYTVDLDDADGGGDVAALAAQLGTAVDRIVALTGRERIVLVAHSTPGVAARVLASDRPDVVRAIVTLGTPHRGGAPAPLADAALAEAVRASRTLAGAALAGTVSGAMLDRLDAALDGVDGAFVASAFVPTPDGLENTVPGLALGSAVGGDLVTSLAQALVARTAAASAGRPATSAPTHLGVGARVRLPVAAAAAGDPELDAVARIDAARIRLVGSAPEPARPPQQVTLEAKADQPGGWLLGDPVGAGPRVRSAEVGVTLSPASAGSVAVAPRLVLRDVVVGSARRDLALGDPGLVEALDALVAGLGPAAARIDVAELAALPTAPAAVLRNHRDDLLDAIEGVMGGELAVALGAVPLELALDRETWTLHLKTTDDFVLAEGVAVTLDGRLDLTTLAPTVDAGLHVGAVKLEFDSTTETLTLAAPPWLPPFVVVPTPSPEVFRDTLAPVIPRVALSAALSAALGELLDVKGTVGALDALFADPGARLAELASGDIQKILRSAARALGVDDTDGLALPGGLLLRSTGGDPLRLELTGTIDLAAGDELEFDLFVDVAANRTVSPGGTLVLDLGLPGTWGRIKVAFGVSAAGVGLAVTPLGQQPIVFLPQFSGFGTLVAAGATTLLPHLLQAIVDELRPAVGQPQGLLAVALALATSLDVYDDDAQGFEEPLRAARLAAMLQPGWLEQQVADPTTLAQHVADLFAPPLLELPLGAIGRAGDRLTWTAPLPLGGGQVIVAAKLGEPPAVTVTVNEFDAGPLVVETAHLGFDGDLAFDVALRLDPGGDLAFLDPVAELGVADGKLSSALLPLGSARRSDLALELAPQPGVTFTEAGAIALISDWGLPLVAMLVFRAVGVGLDAKLWTNGPSAGDVLEGAGLLASSNPPTLAWPLPPLDALALGALQALATGISIDVTDTLELAIVDDAGRKGLRLKGDQVISSESMDVSLRFGEADWLDDANAGVTLWVLRRAQGAQPVALDLGLDAIGLGAMFAGPGALTPEGGDPLIDGALTIGQLGGLLFFELDFLDPAGQPALTAGGFGAALEINDAQISIESSDGDSFIQKLLPKELAAPFSLAVEAREGQGVQLHGGIGSTPGQLELTFPLDLDIGKVIQLREVFLAAGQSGGATTILGAISGGATLGPIDMAVERVGLRVRFEPTGTQFSFKPPDGFGLSITSPAIRAGGYLLVDEARGRYVGAIELVIVDSFSLVAIGILTTKKPDGSPGFSLLLLIAMKLPVPIPLGFGFFFGGAGGLLGLNRGVDLDRLRIGLRSGTADSILFPTDVVRRIDTIVRDLEESFPISQDTFLVAPMALITWSTPPLITAKIGLIIEIGPSFRLAILGVLRMALPEPDAAVVDLKVAFLGAIDVPASLLSFDASIFDSYLGYADFRVSLEGDMALRIAWGAEPDFLTSIGGFYPGFRPAAHLRIPPMRRMSMSLLKDNPRLTLSAYFAVTSNTVQFGARLELVVKAGGFSVEGDFGFDVLVQIVPFHLEAHLWARVSVKAGGADLLTISLDLTLEGPTPWIAKGTGSFKILFISVEVGVEIRIGEAAPATLPTVAVLPDLLAALKADAAWTSELGDGANALVQLEPPPQGTLVIDAAGLLTVSQRLIPLRTTLELVGVATPNDANRVDVHELRVGAQPAQTQDVTDAFAPAAFRRMSDQEKLSAPAFEQRPAGVQSQSGDRLATDAVLGHKVEYETIVFDSAAATEPQRGTGGGPTRAGFEALVPGGAIGDSMLSKAASRKAERGRVLSVAPARERFGVTRLGDVVPLDAAGASAAISDEGVLVSRSDAEARRASLIAAGVATDLQILPEAQLAA